jgi:catechol 2,3-dioxygenase-like lactoylglutathione lyase family enzyme
MNQHLHLVTLGVSDLQRAREFYSETLGWKPARASNEYIAFFQVGGIVLSLFPRGELARDAVSSPAGGEFPGFTLAYNAGSQAEVDEIIRDLQAKGVRIVKQPQRADWGGYSSYFADPDGFLWEVAYNPEFPFDDRGNLSLD